jgi:hypothetical protein
MRNILKNVKLRILYISKNQRLLHSKYLIFNFKFCHIYSMEDVQDQFSAHRAGDSQQDAKWVLLNLLLFINRDIVFSILNFHRTLCLVISYEFKDDKDMNRSCNEADKSNLKAIFSGCQNQIEFISPTAADVAKHLSSQGIKKIFENGKCYAFILC